VRARVHGAQSEAVLADRVNELQVLEKEDGWVDHKQQRCHKNDEGGPEPREECARALQLTKVHVVLDKIAERREHGSELQGVAEPYPRLRDLQSEEDRPTSAAERKGECDHGTNAGVPEHVGRPHELLIIAGDTLLIAITGWASAGASADWRKQRL